LINNYFVKQMEKKNPKDETIYDSTTKTVEECLYYPDTGKTIMKFKYYKDGKKIGEKTVEL
ncbi:MAG: hypothetical protein KAS30_00395, partial [Candidatus Diapherotrites archaeon]|nr:hypothetical protein [Candidatus Diapherotrites archaeon]